MGQNADRHFILRRIGSQQGFTLIETIVTMVVAAVLLTIAVPAFRGMILSSRLATLTNEMVRTLNLARQEAIKRGVRVVMCPSGDAANCIENGQWEQGWIVFSDNDGNNSLDAGDGDSVLWVHDGLEGQVTLRTGNSPFTDGNFSKTLAYLPSGVSRGGGGLATGTFRMCDQRGTDNSFAIIINNVGRVRVEREADQCP